MNPSNPHSYRQFEADLESRLADLDKAGEPDREVRRLALGGAAVAVGRRDVTRAALRIALGHGVDARALREAVLQSYLFVGFPRAINALAELSALLPGESGAETLNLGVDVGRDAEYLARGEVLCRTIYGPSYDALLGTMARIDPDLGRWMVTEGYGKVLSRPGLLPRTRELVAVATLVPLDVPEQLRAHLRGAFYSGSSSGDVRGALAAAFLVAPEREEMALALFEEANRRYGSGGGP